jgi:hypothetical protein
MKTLRRESVVNNENPLKGLKFFSKQLPKAFLHISERKQTSLHLNHYRTLPRAVHIPALCTLL